MAETISAAVIEQARKGDPDAIEIIVSQFRKPLLQYAVHYLNNDSEAEDVTQEALLKILKALPGFKGESSLSTWLYRIMTNTCIDWQRKKVRQKTCYMVGNHEDGVVWASEEPVDPRRLPEEEYEGRELKEMVRQALEDLSPLHRITLILHDLHGFRYQEIAAITNTGLGTVKSRLYYARNEMRRKMAALMKQR